MCWRWGRIELVCVLVVVHVGSVAGFSATGIPDGQGAYRLNSNTIRIIVNSETGNDKGYSAMPANGADP